MTSYREALLTWVKNHPNASYREYFQKRDELRESFQYQVRLLECPECGEINESPRTTCERCFASLVRDATQKEEAESSE